MAQSKTKSATQIMMEYHLKQGGFMANLKTQIETAKKILNNKGCSCLIHGYVLCDDCPADQENSGSICDDKFGSQNTNEFNYRAIAWFENWLKENDVERSCETCRFFWENTKSGKSECPEGLPACGERNNLYKWKPIPKELKDGMDFAAWVPKETPLKPPYVITDIPEDEEIFIKVCEKTGKEWEGLKVPHVTQFAECKGAFPIKLYVRLGLTFSDSDYIPPNEPSVKIHYKDFLKINEENIKMKLPFIITDVEATDSILRKIKTKLLNDYNIDSDVECFYTLGVINLYINLDKHVTWAEKIASKCMEWDKITCNDFLNINQEEVKMKQVILEAPGKEVYIDVQWFKDNKDCGAGEYWFIENYGKDAKVLFCKAGDLLFNQGRSDGLKFMSDHEPQQQLTDDYVYIGDVDKDKIYILVGEHNLYKLQNVQDNKWSFCKLNNSYSIAYGYSYGMEKEITVAISNHKKVYEFKTFKDFTKAHQEGKI